MIDLLQADITSLDVDAIVNAANPALAGGGGVDGAIHRAAGPGLAQAATPLAPCSTGDAVITPGFDLTARYVIHAVGPVWRGGGRGEDALLRQTYERCFAIAREHTDIRTIAFPSISTGVYGFPVEQGAPIAVEVMRRHERAFDRIVACAFDARTFGEYARALQERGYPER